MRSSRSVAGGRTGAALARAVLMLAVALPSLEAAAQRGPTLRQDPLATQQWKTGRDEPRGTIVYLHGLGCDPRDPLIRRLARELGRQGQSYRVVSPWLRPVRQGPRGPVDDGPHTMSDQLQRARRAIEQQEGKVVLLGHSFGGKAALQLAREYPDKVACVVGLAPSVNMLHSYWKRLTGDRGLPADPGRIRRTIGAHQDQLTRQLTLARRQGDRAAARELSGAVGYASVMQDLISFNEPQVEVGLRTPTLVLHGTEDRAVSVHYARRFAEGSPGARLVEIPGVDHHFEPVAPSRNNVDGELARQITRFINPHLGVH